MNISPENSKKQLIEMLESSQRRVSKLQRRVETLEREKRDLEVTLDTITGHADRIEDNLIHKVKKLTIETNDLEMLLDAGSKFSDSISDDLHDEMLHTREESENRFKRVSEIIPVPILVVRASDDIILFANKAAALVFGYTPAELCGRSITVFFQKKEQKKFRDAIKPFGFVKSLELQGQRPDGTDFYVNLAAQTIRFYDESCYLNVLSDITDVKRAEETKKTEEKEKLSTLGVMVAGIAHEINTPVGVSLTNVSFLNEQAQVIQQYLNKEILRKSDLDKFLEDALQTSNSIMANLIRAANLIQSFKQVATDQTYDTIRHFNVKEYIKDTLISFKEKLFNSGHTVNISGVDDVRITSYPGAFFQVISNLVMNSLIHGFENREEGVITIEYMIRDDTLVLKYGDDGKGMPEENRAKIFDPFFTTRRSKGNTGLGMHLVFNLVTQKLKGDISCTSEVGKRTDFEILLPIKLSDSPFEQ